MNAKWPNSKTLSLIGICTIAFFVLLFPRLNFNFNHYGYMAGDEGHTITAGLAAYQGKGPGNFRQTEATRWLARAFYPIPLYFSTILMGGNVYYEGWSYPGHNYLMRAFSSKPAKEIRMDPNLRDFFYYMRTCLVLLFCASFLPLIWFSYSKRYFTTGTALILFPAFSARLLIENNLFLTETTIVICTNLLLVLFLYNEYFPGLFQKHLKKVAFLTAFTLSAKMSTLFYPLLPIVSLVRDSKEAWIGTIKQIVRYGIWIALSLLVINFTAVIKINQFLHSYFSNFWQYSTGFSSADNTVLPGLDHLSYFIAEFKIFAGPIIYLLPILVIAGTWLGNRKERWSLSWLFAVFCLILIPSIEQRIFVFRNAVIFFIPILLLVFLSLDILVRELLPKSSGLKQGLASGSVIALAFIAFLIDQNVNYRCTNNPGPLAHKQCNFWELRFPNCENNVQWVKNNVLDKFGNQDTKVLGIGLSNAATETLEVSETLSEAPKKLYQQNFGSWRQKALDEINSHGDNVILVAKRFGNNKQFTNYLLPMLFEKNDQVCNYFVYYGQRFQPNFSR